MKEAIINSNYFGLILSISLFVLALRIKTRFKLALLNPLLVSTLLCIAVLVIFRIPYDTYKESANLLNYLLTPATVCLAIPMYKQLKLLRDNLVAVIAAITSGTVCSLMSIFIMGRIFRLSSQHIVTLLPKSITTAIGMGVSEEAGGIVTLTVAGIIITGILGNMIAESIFKIFHIDHPIAKGLALGTSAHAVGTAKALELGEVEGAMSSLSICVAGILTVILVPIVTSTFIG
ncbi:LrgB family protein [Oribacterium sp. WCC10]|uniref:LrgB family protein n=1 Tax=Oribacterium sp. WCC10 TaxID=1855343 RepID=UPI0008E9CF50|nr:LrgB family protein [Oribacterium sp. WCC10]SFG34559.1 TIGR00659 family protein [Oribacterium sp. WCC10]